MIEELSIRYLRAGLRSRIPSLDPHSRFTGLKVADLNSLTAAFIGGLDIDQKKADSVAIFQEFPKAFPALARFAAVTRVNATRCVFIGVNNSAMLNEITFLKREILAWLKKADPTIKRLRFLAS